MPAAIDSVWICDRKVSLKQVLPQRPALALPQLLQHLFHCGVAGSSFYYTSSAKIHIPKWQGKLKRKSSCWWDCSEYAMGLSKTKLDGKGKQSSSSLGSQRKLHGQSWAEFALQCSRKLLLAAHAALLQLPQPAALPGAVPHRLPLAQLAGPWAGSAAGCWPTPNGAAVSLPLDRVRKGSGAGRGLLLERGSEVWRRRTHSQQLSISYVVLITFGLLFSFEMGFGLGFLPSFRSRRTCLRRLLPLEERHNRP